MCLAAGLLGCLSLTAAAVERSDFIVNDDGGRAAQSAPRIAVSPGQGFVITWVDRRSTTSSIYLQRFDADGFAVGYNFKINDEQVESYQFEPAVAASLAGGYATVWKDYRNGSYPFDPDIYFQRFDSTVLPLGVNTNLTIEIPDSTKESPDIALSDRGRGVVVWADYRNRNWDIYGQLIAADGSLIGGNFRVNDDTGTGQQHAPRVAVSPQGWFVVTWYDNRDGNDDIFFQRYDSLANRLGVNVKANADSQGARQAFPDIATDGSGHFTVVWVDWRNGTYPLDPDIYSRKYDTLLTPVTDEIRVNTDGLQTAQREPAIAADRMGNVAIVWSDSTSASWDITGQMIDVNGIVREANFRANDFAESAQLDADVAVDGAYRYVCWTDNRNGNWDIFAAVQKYNDLSITAEPAALNFEFVAGESAPPPAAVNVEHSGYNPVDFTVTSDADWLAATPTGGTTPGGLEVSINAAGLPAGTYQGALSITDNLGISSTATVTVSLEVLDHTGQADDTLGVASAAAESGGSASTVVRATLVSEADRISLPLSFDADIVLVDSIVWAGGLPEELDFEAVIDNSAGQLYLDCRTIRSDECFSATSFEVAVIHFTAADVVGVAALVAFSNDTLQPLLARAQVARTPVTVTGYIVVSPVTEAESETGEALPESFLVQQNRPNPFNAMTLIEYYLPEPFEVALEVYNVLGQRVSVLSSGVQPAGWHRAHWEGSLPDGRAAPSGVYFYRLKGDGVSEVRKMVLIK
ncbi:MAG: T9SS type A sorting domain-containing protein [Candidatus Zixiibacteriota bacterium]|nr:MAG: T9SS type A sorting domain-containing protein [candidate division Zixibacteria bacterium]